MLISGRNMEGLMDDYAVFSVLLKERLIGEEVERGCRIVHSKSRSRWQLYT